MGALITFAQIDSLTQGRGEFWFEPVRDACAPAAPGGNGGWDISSTELRLAMFLAETAHESSRYRLLVESLRYSAARLLAVFPTHFSSDDAARMAMDEFAIGERVYGGRMGNGPEGSGDGFRYRGRGILQITGRDSYASMSDALAYDLMADPDKLTVPLWAAFASAAWWNEHGCNAAADDDDFEGVTRIIQLGNRHSSGRINGMPERLAMLQEVQEAMA